MSRPVVAVVVAAGLGSRFGGPVPKQALELCGRSVLGLSIDAMVTGGCTHVVVVLNEKVAAALQPVMDAAAVPVRSVMGGATRQESVYRGLRAVVDDPDLADADVVLIHDAVRPMVPAHVVASVIAAVRAGADAVAPVISVPDSMRVLDAEQGSQVVDRDELRAVQTPQGFPVQLIVASHEQMAAEGGVFTDDVSCAEEAGYAVTLVPGSRLSMKITERTDLLVAEVLWNARVELGHHAP